MPFLVTVTTSHICRSRTSTRDGKYEFFRLGGRGKVVAVMGFQPVKDVTLIRHAYVLPDYEWQGIGTKLVAHMKQIAQARHLLIGI